FLRYESRLALNYLASRSTLRVFSQLSGFPLNFSCFRSIIWFPAQLFVFSLNYLASRSTFRVFAQLFCFPLNFSCFRSTIWLPAQLFVFSLNYPAFRSTSLSYINNSNSRSKIPFSSSLSISIMSSSIGKWVIQWVVGSVPFLKNIGRPTGQYGVAI